MNKLTKEQALEVLVKVTAVYKGTREEHQLIQQALQKLSNLTEVEVDEKNSN